MGRTGHNGDIQFKLSFSAQCLTVDLHTHLYLLLEEASLMMTHEALILSEEEYH